MKKALAALVCGVLGTIWLAATSGDPLEEGFRQPPVEARPSVYYLLLNGYVNRDWVEQELAEYWRMGIGGLCIFDMGARGDPSAQPPPGPEFLSRESAQDLAHIIRVAGRLGMRVELSVSSSWDMGATWVQPEDASMTLVESRLEFDGPKLFDDELPFPEIPAAAPKKPDGSPRFYRDVALLAIRDPAPQPGYEFLFEVQPPWPQQIDRVVLYNTRSGGPEDYFAKDFLVLGSASSTDPAAFQTLVQGSLEPREGPQEFRFPAVQVRYVKLLILNGHNPASQRVQLGEFEAWSVKGENVLLSHRAVRVRDGARLLRYTSALGQVDEWRADNIHDGRKSGPAGSWSSGAVPPMKIGSLKQIVDLTRELHNGRLRWKFPAGHWVLVRYGVTNTGERLKVPSPNSDGLTTDHFNAAATERYIREVIRRLRPALGDFRQTALRELYLASYEVRGGIWTPAFLDEFRRRRGYDLTPYLPVLSGAQVEDEQTTERVLYDFHKTQGELLVDAYYREATRVANEAGLGIQAEAGGPGPPIHQVPVDALTALGAIDSPRGEFWPFRPHASALWVVKETAAAAHIYNKPIVHMEAFTSSRHWQEAPQDLKPAADRAFCEGMNHVVWHTASHQPPEAGKPGWVYYAGTHLTPNVVWWPMARPFIDYLTRASFLLQQGRFVADVLYYYGDQGYNFVPPKHVDPSLGFGFDYDVVNAEVLLNRLYVENGKLKLPHGMEYELLVLPERPDIDLAVLEKVATLVEAGATVVGPKPIRATGYADHTRRDRAVRELAEKLWGPCDGVRVRQHEYGKGKIVWGRPLRELLAERGVGPDFSFRSELAGASLDFIHRRAAGADIYFVRNANRRWERGQATFRVSHKAPEFWDPATGEIRPVDEYEFGEGTVSLPLELEPEGAIFVVFRNVAGESRGKRRLSRRPVEPIELEGPWTVRFPPGWGAPDTIRLDRLISWTEHADPGVRYFSGIAEYSTTFHVPEQWLENAGQPMIDLGDLWAVAEAELNGENLGVAWKRPFRLPARKALRAGRNELRVRVANNWANRLIGDARYPKRRYTRTNVTTTGVPAKPWAEVEPVRSGLFGPVHLLPGPDNGG